MRPTYVLSKAKLLVTNDTGAMHIAEAAGTPVLAIFGPTVRQFGFAPWRKESRVIETELDCLHIARLKTMPQGPFQLHETHHCRAGQRFYGLRTINHIRHKGHKSGIFSYVNSVPFVVKEWELQTLKY